MAGLSARGGCELELAGRPCGAIQELDSGDSLVIPLVNGCFEYSELLVSSGEMVKAGRVLARDPANFNLPLLAPRAGRVNLIREGEFLEIALSFPGETLASSELEDSYSPASAKARLVKGGVWSLFRDALTGRCVDPAVQPEAVIVSTMSLEPFLTRGDVLLSGAVRTFKEGLLHLQSFLNNQQIWLVLPQKQSSLCDEICALLSGEKRIGKLCIEGKYPFDHPALLARNLGLYGAKGPVWHLDVAAVLGIESVLSKGIPHLHQVVAVGGAVSKPGFFRVSIGTPVWRLLEAAGESSGDGRVIRGGFFTGKAVDDFLLGVDSATRGLSVTKGSEGQLLLSFARPGFALRSFFRWAFVGGFIPGSKTFTGKELGGEKRACIACGACLQVCPASLLPQFIHRYLWAKNWDEVERHRLDLCVDCGLCSWVCPSKIDLCSDFLQAKAQLKSFHGEEGELS